MSRQASVTRLFAVAVLLGTLPLSLLPACGGGDSPEEAAAQCEREDEQLLTCPESTFDVCVSCREECGNDCEFVEPCGYTCD